MSRAARRDVERLGDLEHEVGRAELPAFGELRGRGQVLRVAFGGAGLGPVGDRLDLGVAQAAVIVERAEAGLGLPGGHPAALGDLREEARPLGGILVGQQRERPDLARPMAAGAVLPEDRRDVLVVGRALGPGRPRAQNPGQRKDTQESLRHERNSSNKRMLFDPPADHRPKPENHGFGTAGSPAGGLAPARALDSTVIVPLAWATVSPAGLASSLLTTTDHRDEVHSLGVHVVSLFAGHRVGAILDELPGDDALRP